MGSAGPEGYHSAGGGTYSSSQQGKTGQCFEQEQSHQPQHICTLGWWCIVLTTDTRMGCDYFAAVELAMLLFLCKLIQDTWAPHYDT